MNICAKEYALLGELTLREASFYRISFVNNVFECIYLTTYPFSVMVQHEYRCLFRRYPIFQEKPV